MSRTDRCRYTVDKTTREVLFLPLPTAAAGREAVRRRHRRSLSQGIGALFILVLIQPWGFALAWHQLSYVSLARWSLWHFMAFRAKREYLASFRRSIESQ